MAANTFQLTDGTTTVDLAPVLEYDMPPPARQDQLPASLVGNLRLLVTSRSKVADIEALLGVAKRRREQRTGSRAYLHVNIDSETYTWRTEVLGGSIDPVVGQVWRGKMEADLTLVHDPVWERTTVATLATGTLTNDGASKLTLPATAGSMAAPAIVSVKNKTGSLSPKHVLISITPGPHCLTLTGGTINWSSVQDYSQPYLEHDFSTAETAALGGGLFFVAVGLDSATGNSSVRAGLYNHIGAVKEIKAWTDGVYVGTDEEIVVLGPIAIPGSGIDTGVDSVMLALNIEDVSSASPTGQLVVAWIQLIPAGRLARLKQTGYTSELNDAWVDDNLEGWAYLLDVGTGKAVDIIQRSGPRLMLEADVASELRVVFDEYSSGVDATRSMEATVTYRPRRLTI